MMTSWRSIAALASAVTASVWGHSLGTQVQTVVISVAGALMGLEALITSKVRAVGTPSLGTAVEAAVQDFFTKKAGTP